MRLPVHAVRPSGRMWDSGYKTTNAQRTRTARQHNNTTTKRSIDTPCSCWWFAKDKNIPMHINNTVREVVRKSILAWSTQSRNGGYLNVNVVVSSSASQGGAMYMGHLKRRHNGAAMVPIVAERIDRTLNHTCNAAKTRSRATRESTRKQIVCTQSTRKPCDNVKAHGTWLCATRGQRAHQHGAKGAMRKVQGRLSRTTNTTSYK